MISGRRIGKLLGEVFGTGLADRLEHTRMPECGKSPQSQAIGLLIVVPGSRSVPVTTCFYWAVAVDREFRSKITSVST
ncbi:MAG TPA: hypothetical protein VLS26_12420, partial [Azonexus sp.]|nr:hypothetical protein [Azonexus sp.]